MSRSLNDIIKRSGFGEKMGIKLKQKKKPVGEVYSRTIIGKTSGIKIENYSLKSTINEIINYKRNGESKLVARKENFYKVLDNIWKGIVKFFEDIWNFLTTKLQAFWDWITGKGKDSTKSAVEKAFETVSGKNNSTTNTNINNTSKNVGGNSSTEANAQEPPKQQQATSTAKNTSTRDESPRVQVSCIIGNNERFGKANILLMEIVDKTREYANAVTQSGNLIGAYGITTDADEILKAQTDINSPLSKAFNEWVSTVMYGKRVPLDRIYNDSEVPVSREIDERIRQLNDLVGPTCEMNKNNYQDCYSRWKKLEKKIDDLSEELSRLVEAFKGSIKLAKYFSESIYKVIEENEDKFKNVNTQFDSGQFSKLSSKLVGTLKEEETKIMKSMKEFLDKIKPDVNVKF